VIIQVGYFSLVLTFLVALYGVGAATYGAIRRKTQFVESARHAMLLTWPLVTLSVLAIVWLLVSGDFQVHYVYSTTSNDMPVYL